MKNTFLLAFLLLYIPSLAIYANQNIPTIPLTSQECWDQEDCTERLKLSGEIILQNRPPNKSDCLGLSSMIFFTPDMISINQLSRILFYGGDRIKVTIQGDDALHKTLGEKLPQWYKEGLMGEIRFYVKGTFYDFTPAKEVCDGGWLYEIKAKNIEIIEKVNESLSDKRKYSQVYGDTHHTYERLIVNDNIPMINIYELPNGKVLAHIQTNAKNQGLLYQLDGYHHNRWGTQNFPITFYNQPHKRETQGWIKVIYFPPNEHAATKAIVGYVQENMIKGSIMSLDLVEENPLLIIPKHRQDQTFQPVQRPEEKQEVLKPDVQTTPVIELPRTIRTPY